MLVRSEPESGRLHWNWIGVCAVAFCAGLALGNGHTTQGAVAHISDQLGQAKAAAGCENHRASRATAVAGKAILAANLDSMVVPKFRDLPVDNCPHPEKK